MKKTLISLLAACSVSLCLSLTTVKAQETSAALGLWPRGDKTYLAAGQPMPLWPSLPAGTKTAGKLTITLPAGFSITSWGKSKAFAVLPKPLVVPTSVTKQQDDGQKVVYAIEIPTSELPANGSGRLALMVHPGTNPPDDYTAQMQMGELSSQATLTVLPPLNGKRPQRLQIGVYNYNGLTNEAWLKDMEQAVLNSGINTIWDMRPVSAEERPLSLTSRLSSEGVEAGVLWFWKSYAAELGKTFPEAIRKSADGKANPANGIASAWVIANRNKVMPVLEESLKQTLASGLYHSLILDHEERAVSRDGLSADGDLYNPGTVEDFARFAKLDKAPPADAAYIAKHHADQWTEYRTWQSAQLSAIVADALQSIDPLLTYGLYSGYEYAPPLDGSTHRWYSVNWHQMAKEGKIQIGTAGYYGSRADIQNTAQALGKLPFTPAEMYAENFVAPRKTLPEPDAFASRLLAATLNGGGRGVNLWYLSVMDAGAFSAVARVSHLLADAEPFLMDGQRADSLLNLARDIDPANVYVYQLGERRLVIVLNRSAQELKFRAAWKEKLRLPDTTELVSGKKLGESPLMEITLAPHQFAAFLTFSDGN